MKHYRMLIIGAGAAGITAAVSAARAGAEGICIVEREDRVGGVLNQCVHSGFGRGYFGEDMSGTEFAARLSQLLERAVDGGADIRLRTGTIVTALTEERHAFLSARGLYEEVSFDTCVLASGCRETTLQSLPVAGTRPEGIFTAGEAQRMLNIYGRDVGDDIIILGTGDIGQIMARHYIEGGKNLIAMIEQSDKAGGLERNRRNILEKYNVPILLKSTITEVFGTDRVSAVKVRRLDSVEERIMECGTLVTAMGLIPERDLLKTGEVPPWIRLCGNCDFVHDIVDSVCIGAEKLGKAAAAELSK